MNTLPKPGAENSKKRKLQYESILCNSTKLSIDWTSREFQSQIILFLRKIMSSTQLNPELLSLFHICINLMMLPKTTKSKCLDKMHYVCIISMLGSYP